MLNKFYKRTKVLIITTELNFGGVETSVLSRARVLNTDLFDLSFACFWKDGRIATELRNDGFTVHVLNRNPTVRDLRTSHALRRLISEVKPDLLHTISIEANFHGSLAKLLLPGTPLICEEVGAPNEADIAGFRSWRARQLGRFIWNKANRIVAVSKAVRSYVIRYEGARPSKVVVIPHFVEPRFVADFPTIELPRQLNGTIACVGRLSKEKGQRELLGAFALALRALPHLRLWLIGDGPDRFELDQDCDRLGIKSAVEFLGFRNDLDKILPDVDLLVVPSRNEGLGIVALEAMAMGTIVLANPVGGLVEIVSENENGLLNLEGDIEGLANKIVGFFGLNEKDRIELRIAAFETVRNDFSVDIIKQQFSDLYLSTIV